MKNTQDTQYYNAAVRFFIIIIINKIDLLKLFVKLKIFRRNYINLNNHICLVGKLNLASVPLISKFIKFSSVFQVRISIGRMRL